MNMKRLPNILLAMLPLQRTDNEQMNVWYVGLFKSGSLEFTFIRNVMWVFARNTVKLYSVRNYSTSYGRAMAQTVSRRPLIAEARVRSWVSPCGIYSGQSGMGQVFPPSTSVFPCKFHSTGAPLHGKAKKKLVIITGLHNRPQGCGASVASAAGPFITKKPVTV
jgi:hypothetical protein